MFPPTTPSSSWHRATRFAPLAALAVWLLATLGLRPLAVPDEGRYAEVARHMWVSGDWLVPRLDGLPFFHKPPLMYWIDAAGYAVLGAHHVAARLAPALGAWLMGAALWAALRRWRPEAPGHLALCVLATSPLYFLSAQYANLDMLVAGTLSACIVAFARAVEPGSARSLRWLVAAWALAGVSVLAKGLIGIVLPALVVAPWLLWQRRWRDLARALHPLGIAAFAAVALPWCVTMQLRYSGFFDYFIVEQHFRRYAEAHFNNGHGAWYYPVLLPLATLPWSLWLWAAARRRSGEARQAANADTADRGFSGLCTWWALAIVLFFSLPRSKLIGYVLPALLPWTWWLAGAVERAPRRAVRAAFVVALLIDLGAVAAITLHPVRSTADVAAVLSARISDDDRVVFVDDYFYDLPFDARLRAPVVVASDWADPELPRHDNWRKELADAARFDPARGRAVLWPIGRLADAACGPGTTWFIVKPRNAGRLASVAGAVTVFAGREAALFKVPPRPCR